MNNLPHIHLDFPLNVYAHALYLQQGQVDYLHYGLVKEVEDAWEIGALAAQQRLTKLLLTRLPPPPRRVLEIGIGLGTLAAVLTSRGYQVTGISPNSYEIALSQERVSEAAKLDCVSFEEFNAFESSYEVILLQESTQYLRPLTLFNKAHSLLTDKGLLLLVDEFSLQCLPSDGIEGLPRLKYSLAQAKRCGFSLIEQLDLSKQAAPTVDYLLRVITTHRERLLIELNLSIEQLEGLLSSLRLYQQKYFESRYGYELLLFEKTKTPRWKITEVTPEDQAAVRMLFAQVFNHEMSPALWEWKYGQGHGLAIAAWKERKMVAHYGGIIRELLYFGTPKIGVQIADVMVSEQERGILTRRGPYFLVGATFSECYAGYGAQILLGFGFPTQRAIQAAERLGLYAEVGKMTEIHWSTQGGMPHWRTRVRHLHPLEYQADQDVINALWKQMQAFFRHVIIGTRDWHYLQHRYLAHPHKHYEILIVSNRFTGQPLGIVVLHREKEICQLLDIIAPITHIATIIQQTRRIVARWGIPTLSLWITDNFSMLFTQTGGNLHSLDIRIPHCIWYEGPPTEEIRGNWWLTGGDTDFM